MGRNPRASLIVNVRIAPSPLAPTNSTCTAHASAVHACAPVGQPGDALGEGEGTNHTGITRRVIR
jgi:hypothetical protein